MADASSPSRHRLTARPAGPAATPIFVTDPDVVGSLLSDAAHVPGGFASGVAFPVSVAEVSAAVAAAARVLPIGAQSSLTGGATPRGDLLLSTRRLTSISRPRPSASGLTREPSAAGTLDLEVRVGAGVHLSELQRVLSASGLCYPPVPTYDGASVGGTVATNAAGAATFKYGTTREWVAGLTMVLADGSVIDLRRGEVTAASDGTFELERPSGPVTRVAIPTYVMPAVAKLSAGYCARPGMDLVDLFIGSEGTLGVIVEATLVVVRRPTVCVALVACADDRQAIDVTRALRFEAIETWAGRGGLDVAAVEYMDGRSLGYASDDACAKAGVARPSTTASLLLVQIETDGRDEVSLERLQVLLEACHVHADPVVATSGDAAGAARLCALREAVPAGVNAAVGLMQTQVHPDIQKTAGDMIVPIDRLGDSLHLYRSTCERRGLDYAIWGHASDGNLHPNIIPRSLRDLAEGRDALLEIARGVVAMGGSPLAEHGVGRNAVKQRLLEDLYGTGGIEQMRAVKRAFDPSWKLAPGVLFPP